MPSGWLERGHRVEAEGSDSDRLWAWDMPCPHALAASLDLNLVIIKPDEFEHRWIILS
jgi:hypothetical protein